MADLNQGVAKSTSTSASAFSLTSAFFEPSHGSDGPSDLSASNTKAENQEAKRSETVNELDLQDHSSANEEEDIALPASRFSDRLDTNYIPSASEISEINKYVAIVDSKIALCDAQISHLTTALQDLTAKRTTLHDTRTAHCALSSPVRRLPPEILQTIFAWCLPRPRDCFMHASEAPVLLGHVCSEWRRIAHATPALWAALSFRFPHVSPEAPAASQACFARMGELVRMWFARAGACPLYISVWWSGMIFNLEGISNLEWERELCSGLLEVLVPLAARWSVLDLEMPRQMLTPFASLSAADVPLLRDFSFDENRIFVDVPDTRWPEGLNFVQNARGLRTFSLSIDNGGIQLPAIDWAQLTTLCLEASISFFFADRGKMRAALALCANLVSLTIKFPIWDIIPSASRTRLTDATVVLPCLEELCMSGDQRIAGTFHMGSVLASICAPRLRSLNLSGQGGDSAGLEPHELVAVCALLRKSRFPPLQTLIMFSLTTDADELVGLLRMVPTLQELVVHFVAWHLGEVTENQVLLALTISGDSNQKKVGQEDGIPVRELENVVLNEGSVEDDGAAPEDTNFSFMCPNLRYILFAPCNASQQIFCNFVASRWKNLPPGVARIQKVEANFTSHQEEEVKVRMARFMQEGLYASLRYGP